MKQTINNNPTLTTHGFGVEDYADFQVERAKLFNLTNEFDICCKYLAQVAKQNAIDRTRTSYLLKHLVERWAYENKLTPTYIPEGPFITAAIYMGFQFVQIPGTTHVYINM